MKHGRKPTREQRKLIERWHLDSNDWLVVKETPYEMTLEHRHFDKRYKVIPKPKKYEQEDW